MKSKEILHVGIATLGPVRVAHKLCLFRTSPANPDRQIRQAFGIVREWLIGYCLDPEVLLHIGVPTLDGLDLVSYDCCIEFPLPIDEEGPGVTQRTLPGGTYAVLRLPKVHSLISKGIRRLQNEYVPQESLRIDKDRPVYEIYYKDTMEYCLPIAMQQPR